jgi:regulator of sirC expression with transglutaminase-like and TPR domain
MDRLAYDSEAGVARAVSSVDSGRANDAPMAAISVLVSEHRLLMPSAGVERNQSSLLFNSILGSRIGSPIGLAMTYLAARERPTRHPREFQ